MQHPKEKYNILFRTHDINVRYDNVESQNKPQGRKSEKFHSNFKKGPQSIRKREKAFLT